MVKPVFPDSEPIASWYSTHGHAQTRVESEAGDKVLPVPGQPGTFIVDAGGGKFYVVSTSSNRYQINVTGILDQSVLRFAGDPLAGIGAHLGLRATGIRMGIHRDLAPGNVLLYSFEKSMIEEAARANDEWPIGGGFSVVDQAKEHLRASAESLRASAAKFLEASTVPPTGHAKRKKTTALTESLEQMFEAVVEKKMAESALATAEVVAELPQVLAPIHAPGYDAAVDAGAGVRARIVASPEMVSSAEFAKQMGVSRETVNQRRQKGTLLALTHGTRQQRYPTWQLEPKVLEAMPKLLESLSPLDAWTQYFFITQANPALNGLSPLEALRNGQDARVFKVAAEYADVTAPA